MTEASADSQRASVVVVDDEPSVGRIVKSMLALERHTAEVCGSGIELMEILEQRRPDLVILDLNLPDRSGLDLLRDIRSRYGDRITVVILSGEDSDDTRLRLCLAEGAADCLVKPVRLERLLATVRNALTARDLRHQRDANASDLVRARAALAVTLSVAEAAIVIIDGERRVRAWSEPAKGLVPGLVDGAAVDELLVGAGSPGYEESAFEGGALLRFRGAG